MLIEHTITRLNDMRLTGMSEAYSSQRERPNIDEFSFDERFSLLVDQEWTYRQNRRLARLLKAAKLRLPACVEDINYRQPRGLDRNLVVHLAACDWITNSQNVLITGPTGVGKTFIACALAHSACRHGFSARTTECRASYLNWPLPVETDRIPKCWPGSPRYVCLSWTTGERHR